MLPSVKLMRSIFLVAMLAISATSKTQAQSPPNAWQWNVNGNIFAGVNYQHRKAADITEAESQNWLMAMGERPLGTGRLRVHTMFSFEPFTLKEIGSPQVFQTGETFRNARLIDYQHPHDLFSALSVAYARPVGSWTLTTTAAAVGAPALGPPPFMHRPSAAENPQSPLAHHHLDSVHITPGVLTVGLSRAGMGIETSWFRGREPDETRTDIDFGALDSWSLRGTWASGPWSAQLSGARVNEPDPLDPWRHDAADGIGGPHAQRRDFDGSVRRLGTEPRESRQLERHSCSRATSRGSKRTISTRAPSSSARSCRTRTADFFSPCTR